MQEPAELLTPIGVQTLEQDENPDRDDPEELSVHNGQGVPTRDGAYRLYNIRGHLFEVTARYEFIRPIGMGAYGKVCEFRDTKTNTNVAIKKMQHVFWNVVLAKRILREIVILRHMDHINVVKLLNVILPPNPRRFRDVYIVLELMPLDLHNVVFSHRGVENAPDHRLFKYLLFQLFRGLQYIHRRHVWHRDIKPDNILVGDRYNVKFADFGLSRTIPQVEDLVTANVVTPSYRAPELVLGWRHYNGAVDVWSVGCVFMELVLGHHFFPMQGNQLVYIVQLVGTPAKEDLLWLEPETQANVLKVCPIYPRQDFQTLLPGEHYHEAADLMNKIFVFDPRQRITADEALQHPYFRGFAVGQTNAIERIPLDVGLHQVQYTIPSVRQIIYDIAVEFSAKDH